MALTKRDIAKRKSILGYVRKKGFNPIQYGRMWKMKSPFNEESNPSFVIYENSGRFADYSADQQGDIIDLAMLLEGKSFKDSVDILLKDENLKQYEEKKDEAKKPPRLLITKYLETNTNALKNIRDYARSRGIPRGNYMPGRIPVYNILTDKYENKNALVFPHRDDSGYITGFKARIIFDNDQRFTARGRLGFYVLRNKGIGAEKLYVVESETSANSLYCFLKQHQVNFTILCFGGVNQKLKVELPKQYCNLLEKFLVIDFDGDEELYQRRIQRFENLKCKDVKIPVKKGEDINSLYMKGMISKYTRALLGCE
jgi:hypothetical protein